MRRLIISMVALSMLASANAQQVNYEKSVRDAVTQMEQAKSADELMQAVGRLERIANAEPGKWEASYYTAFAKIQVSFGEQDGSKKDAILDEAQKYIDKALGANGNKSELYTLQGFLHQGRIQVSPMMRGQSYSAKAFEAFEKALNENPNNPRAYYLMGQNTVNLPKMFGGGYKNAQQKFEKAKELFELEVKADDINPNWGATSNKRMLEKCQQEEGKS